MLKNIATQTVKVPSMGDSISEGVVAEWKKKPGDAVALDEVVVLLDTDKITVEVRSPVAGVFEEGLHAADSTVPVGAELFKIKAGASAGSKPAAAESSKASSQSAPAASEPAPKAAEKPAATKPASTGTGKKVPVAVPKLTESVNSGSIKEILVKPGQTVKADQIVLTIDTDKIAVDVRTPVAGVVDAVLVKVEQTVNVGDNLINVLEGAVGAEAPAAAEKAAAPAAAPAAASKPAAAPAAASKPAASAASSRPVATASGPVERVDTRVKMTQARKRTAQRLKDSQNTAAILTTFNEVDMHNLMEMREKYKDRFLERFGVKLGFMSAFAKASSIALLENPVVNAVMDGDDIIYRNYVDISVAVSTPTSLVVPVIRNVERMNFAEIERTIAEFGAKAKEGKLTIEDMSGGTFTISNGGVFGSLMGTPIINPPQSAILGMHAINKRAHVVNDKVEVRPIMYIALSYDHRIIDGRDAVTTLKRIKTLIEDPISMLLDL
jgi:2-oxoglutarate dehydrogenase E2 component (dihydrolipoamide succinyltransferase)